MASLLQQAGQRDSQPTPEEQQLYEKAVQYLDRLVTAQAGYERYARILMDAPNIESGAGEVAAEIIIRIESKLELTDAVRTQLIDDVIPEVLEMAAEMGMVTENQITDKLLKAVATRGTEAYAKLREQAGRPIDPEQALSQVEQMEQSGEVDEAIQEMPEDEASETQRLRVMLRGEGGNG